MKSLTITKKRESHIVVAVAGAKEGNTHNL